MQPVMLVCGSRLTFIVVVLSLEALLSVVSLAKSPAAATSDSEKLEAHARGISRRNLTQPIGSSRDKHSAMPESAGRPGSRASAKQRRNNTTVSTLLPSNSHSWKHGSLTRSEAGTATEVDSQRSLAQNTETLFGTEDIQVGCRELRARSYITDGFCTSEKPVQEVVCAGYCLPIMDMPWYAEFVKTLAKTKQKDWQCVEDVVKKKRVKLLCKDATSRHYRIKVVKSCKCKKITNKHNKTTQKKKRKRPDEKAKTNIVS